MNLWIQKHDFISDERDGVEIEEAIKIFSDFDWDSEIVKEETAGAEGKECCPPGLGLVTADDNILHLIPTSRGLMIHYHYNKKKKLLGIFSFDTQQTETVTEFPESEMNEAIRLHDEGENHLLIDFLRAFGKPQH